MYSVGHCRKYEDRECAICFSVGRMFDSTYRQNVLTPCREHATDSIVHRLRDRTLERQEGSPNQRNRAP